MIKPQNLYVDCLSKQLLFNHTVLIDISGIISPFLLEVWTFTSLLYMHANNEADDVQRNMSMIQADNQSDEV